MYVETLRHVIPFFVKPLGDKTENREQCGGNRGSVQRMWELWMGRKLTSPVTRKKQLCTTTSIDDS